MNTIKRLIDFLGEESKKKIFEILIYSIISSMISTSFIILINYSLENGLAGFIDYKIVGAFFAIVILYYFINNTFYKKQIALNQSLNINKTIETVKKIVNSKFDDFEKLNHDKIRSILNRDLRRIVTAVTLIIGFLTNILIVTYCIFYIGLTISWSLLFLTSVLFLVGSKIYISNTKSVKEKYEYARKFTDKYWFNTSIAIRGKKELQFNRNQKNGFYYNDFVKSCNDYYDNMAKAIIQVTNSVVNRNTFYWLTLLITSLYIVFQGGVPIEKYISYIFIFLYLLDPINSIVEIYPKFVDLRVSMNRIDELNENLDLLGREEVLDEKLLSPYEEIRLENVSYKYKNDDEEEYSFELSEIDLTINKNEIVFITGSNGSGKSTLGKVLTGLYKPDSGLIYYNGQIVKDDHLNNYRQTFSPIFADFHLFESIYGIDEDEYQEHLMDHMEMLELEEKTSIINYKIENIELSFGQKKRLALLTSLLENKELYYFDEWAAGQDPHFRKTFYRDFIPKLKAKGKTIVIVSHDEHYFDVADKIYHLEEGRIFSNNKVLM